MAALFGRFFSRLAREFLSEVEAEHGHRFYVRNMLARSRRARHLSLRQSFVNWEPEDMCADLGIISVCVHNVRTWLLILNDYQEGNSTYQTYNPKVFLERIRTTEGSSGTEDPGLTVGNLRESGFDEERILRFYGGPQLG